MGVCGCMVVWLYDCMVVWLCDCVIVGYNYRYILFYAKGYFL